MFGDDPTVAIYIGVGVTLMIVVVGLLWSGKSTPATTTGGISGTDTSAIQDATLGSSTQLTTSSSPLRLLIVPGLILAGFGALIIGVIVPYQKKLSETHETMRLNVGKPLDIPKGSPFTNISTTNTPFVNWAPGSTNIPTAPPVYIPPPTPPL